MGLVVSLVLALVAMRAFSASAAGPTHMARRGITALCAEQRAVDRASGSQVNSSLPGLQQAKKSNPAAYAALSKLMGGKVSCPTPTTAG